MEGIFIDDNGETDFRFRSIAQALIGKADRHTPVWLSLVVEPTPRGF